ncbi:MAG: His/Gly/Thr/Pro-type tRNA ligase C-terminal domain-containing protein, partial [Patescibacteria group bacterium]
NPKDAPEHFEYWREQRMSWYKELGIKEENLRWRQHAADERAHYAKDAWDIEYNTPWGGWKEMAGVHNRGDWDLSRHGKYSGADLSYAVSESKEKYTPYIIETSDGADRATLMFLIDAYTEMEPRSGDEDSKHEKEVVLKLHKSLAPIKVAILPLSKKEPLQKLAKEIQSGIWNDLMTQYDETGSIGKRYRRQDEIGTPYCVTVDFESLEDKKVTVRDRDTMTQDRVAIGDLKKYLLEKFSV